MTPTEEEEILKKVYDAFDAGNPDLVAAKSAEFAALCAANADYRNADSTHSHAEWKGFLVASYKQPAFAAYFAAADNDPVILAARAVIEAAMDATLKVSNR